MLLGPQLQHVCKSGRSCTLLHLCLLVCSECYMSSAMMFLPHYIPPSGYGFPGAPYSPYFRSPQGKVAELRLELNSGGKKDKNHAAKKIALKKIVANMTMSNNDMVALFPDIIGCMDIPSLEIKKMLSTMLA